MMPIVAACRFNFIQFDPVYLEDVAKLRDDVICVSKLLLHTEQQLDDASLSSQ